MHSTTIDRAIWSKLRGLFMGGIPPIMGNIFFVDVNNGADTNNGLTPSTAFATITYALTQCTANNDDYIFVIAVWQETVALNITRTHLIGLGADRNRPTIDWSAAANTAIITVTSLSNNCEIAGFSFGGGAAHGAIENTGGTPMSLHIHDCIFGSQFAANTPQDGINIALNATDLVVENCLFLGADAGAKVNGTITRDGIHFASAGDPIQGKFRNNRFMGIPGVGINVNAAAGMGAFQIEDNHFYIPIFDALAAGWAITLQTNIEGCLVTGNHAMQTGDGTGANPYRDLSTGVIATCENGWGANYDGPALSPGPAVV